MRRLIVPCFIAICLIIVGLGKRQSGKTSITGAGATFPYPLYSKWFYDFHKIKPEIQINYQSIGSGGGIRQLLEQTIDFGATDAPMTDLQIQLSSRPILHIPIAMGAVVVSYHLPQLKERLRLDPSVLSQIFLGKITVWNAPEIVHLNPDIRLPNEPILVVHRSDGSGTTSVFTDFLSRSHEEWKSQVGTGTAVNWPTGLGGKGNEGVAGLIKQTIGAIGYLELNYAQQNHLHFAAILNRAGEFQSPTLGSITLAAENATADLHQSETHDFRLSALDRPGKGVYPISTFTFLIVPQIMSEPQAKGFQEFLKWTLTDGQKVVESLQYAPIPTTLSKRILPVVDQISWTEEQTE